MKWSGVLLVSAFLFSATTRAMPASAQEFEGRWNLTEVDGERTFASWLEIQRSGDGWSGLYLSRSGHPLPARVDVVGDELHVTRLPEEGQPASPNQRFPTLVGRISSGKLEGTGKGSRGEDFTWTGVRQPDRSEGQDRKIAWGEPIHLFNGSDLAGWEKMGGGPSHWKAVDGELVNEKSGANLRTVEKFRDFKLHLEFKIPPGSNSGIYLRGRYETQVADDYGKEPYSRGVGGIYGQVKPGVNAARPAGEWNTVDVTLVGYHVTIEINGQRTIDNAPLPGITGGALDSNEAEPGPLYLQGDHGPVSYRNIVLTPGR